MFDIKLTTTDHKVEEEIDGRDRESDSLRRMSASREAACAEKILTARRSPTALTLIDAIYDKGDDPLKKMWIDSRGQKSGRECEEDLPAIINLLRERNVGHVTHQPINNSVRPGRHDCD
jgi:hypothetical protein